MAGNFLLVCQKKREEIHKFTIQNLYIETFSWFIPNIFQSVWLIYTHTNIRIHVQWKFEFLPSHFSRKTMQTMPYNHGLDSNNWIMSEKSSSAWRWCYCIYILYLHAAAPKSNSILLLIFCQTIKIYSLGGIENCIKMVQKG